MARRQARALNLRRTTDGQTRTLQRFELMTQQRFFAAVESKLVARHDDTTIAVNCQWPLTTILSARQEQTRVFQHH
jgi:hypothetical protein